MVETFVRVADHYTHSFTFAIENEDIITIEMHKRQKSFRIHIFYGESSSLMQMNASQLQTVKKSLPNSE